MRIIKLRKEQYDKAVKNLVLEREFVTEVISIKENLNENVDWDHNVITAFEKYFKKGIVSPSTLTSLVNSGYATVAQLKKAGVKKEKLDMIQKINESESASKLSFYGADDEFITKSDFNKRDIDDNFRRYGKNIYFKTDKYPDIKFSSYDELIDKSKQK